MICLIEIGSKKSDYYCLSVDFFKYLTTMSIKLRKLSLAFFRSE